MTESSVKSADRSVLDSVKVLDEWLGKSYSRNTWLRFENLDMYFRKPLHKLTTIELANMNCDEPGEGTLTRLLPDIEATLKANGYEKLFVENVHNPLLPYFLEKHGFKRVEPIDRFNVHYEKTL